MFRTQDEEAFLMFFAHLQSTPVLYSLGTIDHCQTQRWPRFIKLRLRVHNKYTGTHKKGITDGWRKGTREGAAKGRESQGSGSRAKETSVILPARSGSGLFFEIFHIIAVQTLLRFQTLPDAPHHVSPRGHLHLHAPRSPCALSLPLTSEE